MDRVYRIYDTDGNEVMVTIPKLEDVSLAMGLTFRVYQQNIQDWLTQEVKDDTINDNIEVYIQLMAKAVSAFTNTDLAAIFRLDYSGLLNDEGLFDVNVLARRQIKAKEIGVDMDAVDHILTNLYDRIEDLLQVELMDELTKEYQFHHKGVNYTVPGIIKSHVIGTKTVTKVNFGQAMDSKNIVKYLRALDKGQLFSDKEIEDKKNLLFTNYLRVIAIVAKKEDQEYPEGIVEAEDYVSNQMIEFQDLPWTIAQDCIFFLGGWTRTYLSSKGISIITTPLNRTLTRML